MKVLITGSCGLIGSEAVRYYDSRAELVVGIDNNMRAEFFGADGDTTWMRNRLETECSEYQHIAADIRDRKEVAKIISEIKPDVEVLKE